MSDSDRDGVVSWFSPKLLLGTAKELLIAKILGGHLDWRRVNALHRLDDGSIKVRDASGLGSFDYVADVGESVLATETVARAMANDVIVNGQTFARTGALILGGDAIYPHPTFEAYIERTVSPFEKAESGSDARRTILAIPGNHDWYDSLTAFSRVFFKRSEDANSSGSNSNPFKYFTREQTRSYFAVDLGEKWWLFGLDLQLGADLDGDQVEFFENVCRSHAIGPENKVIVCIPEPSWLGHWDQATTAGTFKSLAKTLCQILRLEHTPETCVDDVGRSVKLWMTGDHHHYARFEKGSGSEQQRFVVCGGGGAHLHPTHTYRGTAEEHCKVSYPSREASRSLAGWNYLVKFLTTSFRSGFFLIPAFLYLLTTWIFGSTLKVVDLVGTSDLSFGNVLSATVEASFKHPSDFIWLVLLYVLFVQFADLPSEPRWKRWGVPLVHLAAHLGVTFASAFFVLEMLLIFGGNPAYDGAWNFFLVFGLQLLVGLVIGGVVGTSIVGLYLMAMMRFMGVHGPHAFSAVPNYSYRSWMRLRVEKGGVLHAAAFGIDELPKAGDRPTVKLIDEFVVG